MKEMQFNVSPYSEVRQFLPLAIRQKIEDKAHTQCVCACNEKEIMGICVVECLDERKTLEIKFLYVLEQFRRMGIATAMYRFMVEKLGCGFVSCRLLMARKNKDDAMDALLKSLGFMEVELNGSLYIVDRKNWMDKVMPVIGLFAGNTVGDYGCYSEDCLTHYQRLQLQEASMQPNVPPALRLDGYDAKEHVRIVFYSTEDKLVGWMVLTHKEGKEVTLSVIYILPEHRGGRLVFSLYRTATSYVLEHWPEVDRLHFYLDTYDTALGNFYRRLLRHADYHCLKKFKYEISLL